MDPIAIGLLGIVAMVILIVVGVPIGIALLVVGAVGNSLLSGWSQTAFQIVSVLRESGTNFLLVALPMFVLMGQLTFHAGLAKDLYDTVYKWFGWLPGGLAVSTIVTSAGFGAVTGSSFATVHTMGTMVMPEIKRFKYDIGLATGSIAAAGTLAIMIPPSIVLVVYGILTESDVGQLFIAGIVPGVLLTAMFAIYVVGRCVLSPELGPAGPQFSFRDRISALRNLLPTLAIFVTVLGGIYGGVFSPTEAAAIGAAGVMVVALFMRRLTLGVLSASLRESANVSGTIFIILIGGLLMSRFLVQTGITPTLIAWIGGLGVNRYIIMVGFALMYTALGCILDVFGMLILTLPFIFPIVLALEFDRVWFGIFITVMAEIALITPPVGLNVYIIQTVVPEVPLSRIFGGVAPFVALCIIFVALLLAFPAIALWLPATIR